MTRLIDADEFELYVQKEWENNEISNSDWIQFREWLRDQETVVDPIEYRDCANAMLRMWMDGVVTDGEYGRIMDKLNAYWRERHAHVPG